MDQMAIDRAQPVLCEVVRRALLETAPSAVAAEARFCSKQCQPTCWIPRRWHSASILRATSAPCPCRAMSGLVAMPSSARSQPRSRSCTRPATPAHGSGRGQNRAAGMPRLSHSRQPRSASSARPVNSLRCKSAASTASTRGRSKQGVLRRRCTGEIALARVQRAPWAW